ncbi:MAG: hypothetical protein MJ237_07835 [bacterium]|nr:hypothetical protein [bacterium]
MAGEEIGYTHSYFAWGSNLRTIAEKYDKKENGGNDNGLIDKGEIQKFKDEVEQQYGAIFDFANLSQSISKAVPTEGHTTVDGLNSDYSNNGANRKSTIFLNGKKNPYNQAECNIPKKALIAWVDETEFEDGTAYANKIEKDIKENLENKKKQPENHRNSLSDIFLKTLRRWWVGLSFIQLTSSNK